MRRAPLLGTVIFLSALANAEAADPRRNSVGGPPPPPPVYKPTADYDWGGLYGGVHAGMGTGDYRSGTNTMSSGLFPFSEFSPQIAIYSQAVQSSLSDQKLQFGGFVGQNFVSDDLVLGWELDYTSFAGGLKGVDSAGISRFEFFEEIGLTRQRHVAVSNTNSFTYKDALVAKARFGQAFDRFLPYGFIGAGAVRVDNSVSGSARVFVAETDGTIVRGPGTETARKRYNRIVPALAAGLGLEYAVTDGIILRGEYMYLGLGRMSGAEGYINTFRGGVAAKF